MRKDEVLNFRVSTDLKVALRRAADQDDRSMSTMAARILREWLTQHGFMGVKDGSPRSRPRTRR